MAEASPKECRETTWELSKENVQPVKTGRNVNCIAAVLQPSPEDLDRLMKEKQVFEEEIIAGENSDDPIQAWDSYLKWTIQNFPSGGNDLALLNLLRKFVGKFKSQKYKNDFRYVNAWLKLAEIMKDPFETYSFMNTEGIGRECAQFYIAWADEYEKYGDMKRADRIYNDGDEKCAQPRDLLQKHHMEFQLRVARDMLNNRSEPPEDEEAEPQHRATLSQLSGKGKHKTIGTQRNGRALRTIQGSGSVWGQATTPASQTSGGFQIFEDAPSGVSVMGETGKWASAPSSAATKENSTKPGQWKGVKVKQKHVRSQLVTSMPPPPSSDFTVYEDDVATSGFRNEPHKIATNIESILSEKKETKIDFSNIKSAIDEMPVHEGNVTSGYDVDKVYTVMGEMQFEEVRAAHWRKRQKVLAEQAAIIRLEQERLERERLMKEQEDRLEEERRRLHAEKMKFLEQERRWMELERMQMQEKRSELENRLRQIKVLEKSAKTVEEERMLQKEEEDITIQLNAVRRNIRRASMKDCHEIEAASVSAQVKNEFEIYDEVENQEPNEIENEIRPHQQVFSAIKPTSANNSLNHSKRSQPSPTVNTKEAMSQINEWFQKPLDDGNFANVTCDFANESLSLHHEVQPYSFKPIEDPPSVPAQQPSLRNENADPFHIFTDEDENILNNRPAMAKKGLTSRQPISEDENTIGVKPQESHYQEEDKTGFCFDDVTVAGSHFAAKAHMASTPFCSKIDKIQDMTQLNHLSRIQPELTENLGLYQRPVNLPDTSTSDIPPPCQQEEADSQSQVGSEMFYTLEKEGEVQAADEPKQLSPIMEASNESEKSSVMGTTKTSRGDSESDGSQHPLNNIHLHPEPLKMKSFGSVFSHTPTTQSPATGLKKNDVFCFDDFLSNGSIDCNLWDDDGEAPSAQQEKPNPEVRQNRYAADDVILSNANVVSGNVPSISTTKYEAKVDDIASNLKATSILDEYSAPSLDPHCQLSNMIPDPWNRDLLNSILKKCGSLVLDSKVKVQHKNSETVPKLKKGAHFNLDGHTFNIGQLIGEGAYAKVFTVTKDQCHSNLVVKVQFPPCPWEVYVISQAKHRLLQSRMDDIANSIIDIDSAFFFKDGSLLFMPYVNNGTLLDLINANKGAEKMKDVIAMWIAYQVMNIVHGLHTVGFIHGDVKPDNFVVVPEDSDDSSECLKVGGIKLIDFGQAIDMTEMPRGASFLRCCPTSAFTCIQMRNKEPWNYHTDFYGIAGTLHVVLFGSYMTVRQGKDGKWEITNKIKRWHDGTFWREFFSTLLNFPTPTKEHPITQVDSPLPRLIEEVRSILEESDSPMDTVAPFLRRS